MQQSPAIKLTLFTGGRFADDGQSQQTDIVIVPKASSTVGYDAKAVYTTTDNSTITYIVKDSKVYIEKKTISNVVTKDCANVDALPNIHKIIQAISNAEAVDDDSIYSAMLKCPEGKSLQLVHSIWEGLSFFYCYNAETKRLGSFLGDAMVGRVEYLAGDEASTAIKSIEAPQGVTCETLDLKQLEKTPEQLLQLTSANRRLSQQSTDDELCPEKVRFGECYYCSADESPTVHDDNLPHGPSEASWAFNELGINLYISLDLPILMPQFELYIRRRLGEAVSIAGRDGYTCVYIHGAGVTADAAAVVDEFDDYWGAYTRIHAPCYCSQVKYIVLNTANQTYSDASLQTEFVQQLKAIRDSTASPYKVDEMVLITHGTGGLMLSHALASGKIEMADDAKWYSIFTPTQGTHLLQYLRASCPSESFENVLKKITANPITCVAAGKTGYDDLDNPSAATQSAFNNHVTKAVCGVTVSNAKSINQDYMSATTESNAKPLQKYSDGVTRVGSCLTLEQGKSEIDPRFKLLSSNFWEGQMQTSDRIIQGTGVRSWLAARVQDFEVYAQNEAKKNKST